MELETLREIKRIAKQSGINEKLLKKQVKDIKKYMDEGSPYGDGKAGFLKWMSIRKSNIK